MVCMKSLVPSTKVASGNSACKASRRAPASTNSGASGTTTTKRMGPQILETTPNRKHHFCCSDQDGLCLWKYYFRLSWLMKHRTWKYNQEKTKICLSKPWYHGAGYYGCSSPNASNHSEKKTWTKHANKRICRYTHSVTLAIHQPIRSMVIPNYSMQARCTNFVLKATQTKLNMGISINRGTPKSLVYDGNLIKMDDLGVSPF